jgi:hypothetical protein
MVQNINLRYLQVTDAFEHECHVLVLTICNNKKRLYTTKSGKEVNFDAIEGIFGLRDSSIFPPTTSMEYGKKPVTPIITITCNSLEDTFLIGN